MSFVIEPRNMSCVYQDDPYVGRGLTARWFVFDEETGATLANNGGKGYASFQKAYWAYQWQVKGPPSIKVQKIEQEMLYEWSLKNKILTDRLDRIAMHYEQEGKSLTPKHIMILFDTNHMSCPTEPEKFLAAYQNGFYKEIVLKRREQQAKRDALYKKWNIKSKITDYANSNETITKIKLQAERAAVLLEPVANKIHDHMKDYEDRPQTPDAVATARMLSYVSPVQVSGTGMRFPHHEWEIVELDPNTHPIYDTFGQEGPSTVNRVMERQYVAAANKGLYRSVNMMVDPITYQIVPCGVSRCANSQEWQKMAGKPKKKKKRPASDFSTIPKDWVGVPEKTDKQKIVSSSESKRQEDIEKSKAKTQKKGQRIRPEGLPPKKGPIPKPPIKDRLNSKIKNLQEEWQVDDDELDDEEYDIPTMREVFAKTKQSISKFFSDIKEEADKQKDEEQAQKELKRQKKEAKKQNKAAVNNTDDSFDFIDSIVPDVKETTSSKTTDSDI